MRRALLAVVLAVSGTGAASAQDAASSRVAGAHSIDWNGLYVGGSANYFRTDPSSNVSGSLFTGYNFGAGPAIVGVEGGVTLTDIQVTPAQRLNSVIDLRGRLGVAFSNLQVYGTAGAAWAPDSATGGDTGFAAGAGVEGALTERTFWGLQYVRYNFRNFRNTGNTLEVDLFSGRVSYKF
mgnify:CR=1 FL=1